MLNYWRRKEKQNKNDQSFKATSAFYTARNSVAVLIPKYFILARLTGVCVCLLPNGAALVIINRLNGETLPPTAGQLALTVTPPSRQRNQGSGDGVRVRFPVSAVTVRCPAQLNSQFKTNVIHLR